MTKARITQLVTVVLLAGLLGIALLRNRAGKTSIVAADPTPEDTIYAMLDSARAGNASAYLDHYTGQMKQTLKQLINEQSQSKFADDLKKSNAEMKGVALSPSEPGVDGTVKVRVEYVYSDRNEAQLFYLRKEGNTWKIYQVDGASRAKTLVPYGTPVTE
jgi:hypothetical protein